MATPTNSHSRLSVGPWGVRLTPSSANPKTRSIKGSNGSSSSSSRRDDAGLSLRHVIGTTANSSNSISTLPHKRLLAVTAGAAAVICSFDEKLGFTQRFYRARPKAVPLNPIPVVYGPSTPNGASEFRSRASNRDSVVGNSAPFSPTDWSDSPGGKSFTARDRVKAATCVSFSPDGKYLAVGETGYRPRVLIFSTSKEASPDCPLTCLPDHTFGVPCVAFSPNSQYLASLGSSTDGYLYIWNINSRNGAASLFASNKCTSNICQIAWMGSSLITVGTRHVKVWRIDGSAASTPITTPVKTLAGFFSPGSSTSSHRILQGRNCLLGALLEGTFTAVVPISSSQAIVCSESGDICLLDDTTGNQRFYKVVGVDFAISSATLGPSGDLIVAGRGVLACFDVDELINSTSGELEPVATMDSQSEFNAIVALSALGNHIITVDDHRIIKLLHPPSVKQPDSSSLELQLPAHGGAVLGVRCLPAHDVLGAAFYTWSADGTILFWSTEGICKRQFLIQLDQVETNDPNGLNELKVVRTLPSARVMVTGDKFGVLRIVDEKTGRCAYTLHAHSGEITDIAVLDKRSIIASCGRDRTVQVFQKTSAGWELQQTLDEHVGAVTGLMFTSDGKYLISSSSDRTIVIREALTRNEKGDSFTAFVILRTITLKATPVSMTLFNDRDDVLLLTTIDRCVLKYNLGNGHAIGSFKTADPEGGESVVLSSLTHLTSINGSNILAGVSSTDKSLRLYDESGALLSRDWGHTEGITDLTIIGSKSSPSKSGPLDQKCLVTVAVDGTVFIWTFGARAPASTKPQLSSSMELMGITPTKDILANKPPLRRVLSQSEMARFRQSSPEQEEMTTPTNPIKRVPTRHTLEKKTSRFSLAQTPKLEPSLSSYDSTGRRRTRTARSPSPPSPHRRSPPRLSAATVKRRASMESSRLRSSTRNTPVAQSTPTPAPSSTSLNASVNGGGKTDLSASTDIICRALRSYRRKLASTNENLAPETLRDIEREIGLTARAIGEKAIKAKGAVEESVMVKVLNQYSERLIEMLDERFKGVLTIKEGTGGGPGNGHEREESITGSGSATEEDSGPGAISEVEKRGSINGNGIKEEVEKERKRDVLRVSTGSVRSVSRISTV